MKQPCFYIAKGNHGATYVLNSKNWESIRYSLKFYNATSIKAKLLKPAFHVYLFLRGQLFANTLKNATVINSYLQNYSKTDTYFNINNNCSVLVAPTQDKITVHHHQQYFQKFAFTNSYSKVKKEAQIYALFKRPLIHFQVSKYYDALDENDKIMSFKLSNENINTQEAKQSQYSLVTLLIEFFKTVPQRKSTVKTYVGKLIIDLQKLTNNTFKNQLQILEDLYASSEALAFPLGLVHRDFKPWNIIHFNKPLIFDFEEAIVEGLPLEDLLNYYIDPIIRFKKTKNVVSLALNKDQLKQYRDYLKKLNISIDFKVFLHFYLMERILFFSKANEIDISDKYLDLSNYLIENKWK